MKETRISSLQRIVLVSTPWPLYNRPSIQLGALKACLRQEFPELKVHALHVYLKVAESIGYKLYHAISERTWLAEMVYAALLFPERKAQIEKIFYREAKGKPQLRGVDFTDLTSQVKDVSESFIKMGDWGHCGLAGFSVSLCQLTSSLYFITRVKDKSPNLPVVVGGSMFAGDAVWGPLQSFPQIDAVVNGEGELSISQLVRHLMNSENLDDMPPTPGIVTAKTRKDGTTPAFHQMASLSDLPVPDYDDYFRLLKTFSSERTFFPTLPAEISRGCWWRHKDRGCAFCNLNLQWEGYRSKTPKQVVSELDHLTARYKVLSVAFMDNLLPARESRRIFEQLAQLNKDFRLFAEIRASTPKHVLEAMKAAGTDEVQIGVEALSTRLLKKLNKGTTAIQNLEIMKHCEELGITNVSNLILHFPGSDERDVEETLRNLEFASVFRPLRFVHFWLGLGSPVWQDPKAFGLKAVFNHPNYAAIFPPVILRSMQNMIQAYHGDLGHQRKLWRPVKKRVRAWKKAYAEMHQRPASTPILSYRDGREFLIIRQKRLNAEPMTHRLLGTSRAMYLFCQTHRSLVSILERFPEVPEDKVLPFLKMMVDKKLIFEESGRYLSLAVSLKPTQS